MTDIMAKATGKAAEKPTDLVAGDDLKAAALRYSGEMRARIEGEQHGLPSVFDSWCTRVLTQLVSLDPARAWEDSVSENALREPARFGACSGTCNGCASSSTATGKAASSNTQRGSVPARIIIRASAPNSGPTCF